MEGNIGYNDIIFYNSPAGNVKVEVIFENETFCFGSKLDSFIYKKISFFSLISCHLNQFLFN